MSVVRSKARYAGTGHLPFPYVVVYRIKGAVVEVYESGTEHRTAWPGHLRCDRLQLIPFARRKKQIGLQPVLSRIQVVVPAAQLIQLLMCPAFENLT